MRYQRYSNLSTLALVASFAAACAAAPSGNRLIDDPGSDDPGVTDPGNEPGNNPTPNTPKTPKYSGVYQVSAPVDFTQQGVLPGLTGPLLASLAQLHDNPGKSIVDLAFAANVPVIKDMSAFLRDVLASIITTVANDFIGDNPEFGQVIEVIDSIFEVTQQSSIESKITVHTPATDGSVAAEIQVTGAKFMFLNQSISVTTPATAMATAKSSLTATLKARANAPVADADVTFTGGKLSLPVGTFILQALGPLLFQPKFGTSDLRSTLIKLVPCESWSTKIAEKAANDNALKYVITAPVMKTICTTAVGYAADKVNEAFAKLTIDDVQVVNGRATLYDTSTMKPSMDHQSDRLADGTWSWQFGSVTVPSNLAGDRVGTAF